MRKISVLHITQSSGGVQTYLENFVQAMNHEHFQNVLVTSASEALYKNAKLIFDEVRAVRMTRSINPVVDCLAIVSLWNFLRKKRFDIVHVHSSKAGLLGRVAARLAGVRTVVYSPHGFAHLSHNGFLRRAALIWERIAGRLLTSHMLGTSPSEAKRAQEDVRYPPGRISYVFNGIKIDDGNGTTTVLSQTPTIVTFLRFTPVKNPMMVLRVARLVLGKQPNARFLVIGEGYHDSLGARMRSYLRQSRIGEAVQLVPWMDRDKALRLLAKSWIYISTSRSECFGYAVVEAMALEKPVVATDVDGTRDVVVDGTTGWLVRLDDDYAMAARVLELLNDKQKRESFGLAATRRVREVFNVRKNVKDLEAAYVSLIK